MELNAITEADGRAAADALVAGRARVVAEEAREVLWVAHWADLHAVSSGSAVPGTERVRAYGGAGTPGVAEFAVVELALLLGVSPVSGSCLVRDVLDVRFRHPLLWALLQTAAALGTDSGGHSGGDGAGSATAADLSARGRLPRVWQARHVARACHGAGLTREQAWWVDEETSPYLGLLPWGRFCDLLQAKIIEVDPGAAEARRVAAERRRFVAVGQSDEEGLKSLLARGTAGDVVVFVAMCDRIAQILAVEGDTDPVDARRSKAIGILAEPARALSLLLRHALLHDTALETPAGAHGTGGSQTSDDAWTDDSKGGLGEGGGADSDATREESEAEQGPGIDVVLARLFADRTPAGHEPTRSAGPVDTDDRLPLRWLRPPDPDLDPGPNLAAGPDCEARGGIAAVHDLGLHAAVVDAEQVATRGAADGTFLDPAGDAPGEGSAPIHSSGDPGGLSARQFRERAGLRDLARLLDLTAPQLDRLRSRITLYVHTHRATLEDGGSGVVRGEDGLGPMTRGQLIDLLGHARITLTEVVDLAGQPAVDAYETPRRLREALRLASPATAFPHSPLATARTDIDHTIPYLARSRGGPPGQTRLDNLGLLGRTAHRIKTHAPGWLHTQPHPGTHLWRTPHGYWYRVDHDGTHPLGTHPTHAATSHADLIHGPTLDWQAA